MNDEQDHVTEEQLGDHQDGVLSNYIAEHSALFHVLPYQQVFYPPSRDASVNALFPEGYFASAKLILQGIASGELHEQVHGVAAIFLSRHYLELALKYTLYQSRWLKDERTNAAADEVEPVGKDQHKLKPLWDKLIRELNSRTPSLVRGFDLSFVESLVNEFHEVDDRGMRFRYPGEQLPVAPSSAKNLGIDFAQLSFNLTRVDRILTTIHNCLVEQYGENRLFEPEM